MGRPYLTAGEIYRIEYVEYLINAYKMRHASPDWTVFTNQYPETAEELGWAGLLANE